MRWSWRLWPPVPWGEPRPPTRGTVSLPVPPVVPAPGSVWDGPPPPFGGSDRRYDVYARDFLADLDEPQYELVEKPARKQPKYPPTKEPAVTYHPPETPSEVAAEMDARAAREAAARATHEERLAELRREATWGLSWEERKHPRTRTRALTLNCPRCGAEVEFRVDSADVTVAAQTVAGRVHLLRADVDLTGGHTCEVGA